MRVLGFGKTDSLSVYSMNKDCGFRQCPFRQQDNKETNIERFYSFFI